MSYIELAVYAVPMLIVWVAYGLYKHRKHQKAAIRKLGAVEAGLTEPASLHPVIDPNKCLGCGACTRACPEGDILGLINGKAELVEPTNCIGHGACKAACPFEAITLVFGTEKRGMDIPILSSTFETNVPGMFIAGELGGMGLIRNAIEQGIQAISGIQKVVAQKHTQQYDVIIVGAGPAGIASALAAKKQGLKFLILEQDSLGGTVAHYPRKKMIMTAPVDLPLVGKVKLKETSKEALLEMWQGIISEQKLSINFKERLENTTALENNRGFSIQTTKATYTTRCLLLCLGRRGTPRKLNVKGEELSKVVYRLIDPAQYEGQHVLVVGGGDSALEAATSIADEAGTKVTLSYRGESFSRAKQKNRELAETLAQQNKLTIVLQSNVQEITESHVTLEQNGTVKTLPNDAVIVCAGGILPTPFLEKLGIEVETKHGQE
ncbi:MAG TPA: NAD(P)-binding domain-containing protein [Marinagarivorans sp.]